MNNIDKNNFLKDITLGLQHTFTMFGSVVLVPKLLGLDISVAIFMAGIETLIFHFFTKGRIPIFLGSSFELMPPIIAATALYGTEYALGGIVICSLVYIIGSMLVYHIGFKKIIAIFPPVITGSISIAVGLSLANHAISLSNENWFLATLTFLIVTLINIYCKGITKILSIFLGLSISYGLSIMLTIFTNYSLIDFSSLNQASWFGIPEFSIAKFNLESILLILPYTICSMVDHIGDIVVTGAIVKKDFVKNPGLHRTLLGDGIAMSISSLFGGPPNATYSENIGVLALTQNFNPKVIRIAAVFSIILSFVPKLSVLIMTIPNSIIGGVSIVLFGTISAMGINQFIEKKVDMTKPKNIILVTTIFILSLGGASLNISLFNMKFVIEGLGLASIVGIMLNLLFNSLDYLIRR
ncbi:uracil-xanthine permease family protein [Vagococcus lutrae]|uniref:uracil-xanthine permease family protein n=1 Tax=Vagococcus lutrae TaxID=81947 RepID=UPI00200BA1BE|nr:solute carrier family 23 protein [Vagococcus lutrae]MDT2824171.1 solute carrier family 23 protein [Vagococcus lutrae]UQF18314.1 NCS2 family nucleobase:cation symporter [Vagococcus lutrae]